MGQQISATFDTGTIVYSIRPPEGMFAYIIYNVRFSPRMVPGAFSVVVHQPGHAILRVTVTQDIIDTDLNFFTVVTRASPINITATNSSVIIQYYEHNYEMLIVYSEGDYNLIMNTLSEFNQRGFAQVMRMLKPPLMAIRR